MLSLILLSYRKTGLKSMCMIFRNKNTPIDEQAFYVYIYAANSYLTCLLQLYLRQDHYID